MQTVQFLDASGSLFLGLLHSNDRPVVKLASLLSFIWPTGFLYTAVIAVFTAIVIPWCFSRWTGFVIGVILNVAAGLVWASYERHLGDLARNAGPLIRADLILMVPVFIYAILNPFVVLIIGWLRDQSQPNG